MRPGDQAVALLFLMEYDRRRWQDDRFRAAYNTGRLARSTMVEDHIIPIKRGGGGLGIANVRWATKAVNLAKRDLTDEEFLILCRSVVDGAVQAG